VCQGPASSWRTFEFPSSTRGPLSSLSLKTPTTNQPHRPPCSPFDPPRPSARPPQTTRKPSTTGVSAANVWVGLRKGNQPSCSFLPVRETGGQWIEVPNFLLQIGTSVLLPPGFRPTRMRPSFPPAGFLSRKKLPPQPELDFTTKLPLSFADLGQGPLLLTTDPPKCRFRSKHRRATMCSRKAGLGSEKTPTGTDFSSRV